MTQIFNSLHFSPFPILPVGHGFSAFGEVLQAFSSYLLTKIRSIYNKSAPSSASPHDQVSPSKRQTEKYDPLIEALGELSFSTNEQLLLAKSRKFDIPTSEAPEHYKEETAEVHELSKQYLMIIKHTTHSLHTTNSTTTLPRISPTHRRESTHSLHTTNSTTTLPRIPPTHRRESYIYFPSKTFRTQHRKPTRHSPIFIKPVLIGQESTPIRQTTLPQLRPLIPPPRRLIVPLPRSLSLIQGSSYSKMPKKNSRKKSTPKESQKTREEQSGSLKAPKIEPEKNKKLQQLNKQERAQYEKIFNNDDNVSLIILQNEIENPIDSQYFTTCEEEFVPKIPR